MVDASIEDQILIREAYGRYALAASRQDGAAWLGSWTQGGHWTTPSFEAHGQAELQRYWDLTWTMFKSVCAFNEIGDIDVQGDNATAGSIVHEIIQLMSGETTTMTGRYEDRLAREGDRWRFAARHYTLISAAAGNPLVAAG